MSVILDQVFGDGTGLVPQTDGLSLGAGQSLGVDETNLGYARLFAMASGLPAPEFLKVGRYGVLAIDGSLLHTVMPHLSVERAQDFAPWLAQYFFSYQIDTLPRISAFIGNTAVESGQYLHVEENTNYTRADRLMKIFPREFPTLASAQPYAGHPEMIANRAYAGRNGNGDEKSGDGWRYRGRGLIQVTGKANYTRFAADTGADAVNNPDLLAQPQYAVLSAAWFWNSNNLNLYADAHHFKTLAVRINGTNPPLGWHEREQFRLAAARVMLNRFDDTHAV